METALSSTPLVASFPEGVFERVGFGPAWAGGFCEDFRSFDRLKVAVFGACERVRGLWHHVAARRRWKS